MNLLEAARALRQRKISSVELTRSALDRISELNPALNAFITVTGDRALEQARNADDELAGGIYRGLLHGIPIAHKDCFATAGIRTTGGSKILANRIPNHDATVVTKLDQAGAVMLGKTNLHELCYGITSTNPHFGAVHNPWDPERIPGGSSGGSAAAVAAGLVFAASGTDTGGSIRVPASFSGVVGLKPTYGVVSRRGLLPLGITLDHVGPIASTVRGVEACFRAMAPHVLNVEREPNRDGMKGLRIGVPENFFFERLAPEVMAAVRKAVQTAAALGASVREVRVPGMEELNTIGRMILLAEAASIWKARLDRPQDFGSDVATALQKGLEISAADYLDAQRQRRGIFRMLDPLWTEIDCLFTPATPATAPKIGDTTIRIGGVEEDVRVGSTRLVRPFNVIGWPALAMPCGFSEARLPIGLQIVAAPRNEEALFQAGAALEYALGFSQRESPIS